MKKTKGEMNGNDKENSPLIYLSYYIFGYYESKPIWDWENWSKCAEIIQPIINLSPVTPFIKTSQSIPSNKGYLAFGRMIWNHRNNIKWTTKHSSEKRWTFFDTEIAFPTRSYCHKNRGIHPDLLIFVKNENLSGRENAQINQSITIHIGTHLIDEGKISDIELQIHKVAKLLNVKISGKIKRPSAYKSHYGFGYTDSYWHGTHGVLSIHALEFSENYKKYGIVEFRK